MASTTDQSLLSSETAEDEEAPYRSLLLQATQEMQGAISREPQSKQIRPQPGFCLKTRTSQNDKVFVNVCKSEHIPAPPELSEQGLVSLLESEDPSGYRVPISLGEPHAEVDNSGNGCTAYDIAINTSFFEKIQANPLFMEFLVTVALEGLENKYGLELSREWRVLKNRKFMGLVMDQNIRTKSQPIIQEIDKSEAPKLSSETRLSEPQSSPEVPVSRILAEPADGHPRFLVAEIALPKVPSARSLVLDLGEDRIVLWARPSLYHLDIFLPYNVIQEECGAQFQRNRKVLTLTMPVRPL
ncbi:PIH1 domain-containing protein 1 isoform X3 [Rhinatrema bivittatum]|nr:PIH1 domain-containing protein 1 isoform X3 [Rhinatrema bivittatum]XP_029441298.1 PIH1 domain-containing protein 1 isoform X3 [Rhinatrema bivittatum]XP_029441299.1 PIH1 domain-containing protein 1 isoform X3 [Rhinatrema bivittatum]XP_029441300.1 PIH1 domain-containing protein 1 isoform X3 [Rhinatrema bivittatum]